MKRTYLILLCLVAYIPVFSQADTIADNVYEYNGNLGIGLSNPATSLHLKGAFPDGEQRNLLMLQNTDDGGLSFTGIKMLTGNSGGYSMIADAGINYSGSPGYNNPGFLGLANNANGVLLNAGSTNGIIKFLTGINPSDSGWCERMRITSDGNIGIGLTNPTALLHLSTDVSSGEQRNLLRLHNTNDDGLSFTGIKMLTGNSGGYSVIMHVGNNYSSVPSYHINGFLGIGNRGSGIFLNAEADTGVIRFLAGVNPSNGGWYERMRITSDGNIGIGTTTPASKLEVNGMIHSTIEGYKFPDGTIQTTAANDSGTNYWNLSGNNVYYNNGNVGIGLTNPTALLHLSKDVSSGEERNLLRLHNTDDGGLSFTGIKMLTGNSGGYSVIMHVGNNYSSVPSYHINGFLGIGNRGSGIFLNAEADTGVIRFLAGVNPSTGGWYERMLINHDGNIGIGTTTPASKLEVNGMIHSTTEGFKFPDGTIQTTAANGSSDNYWESINNCIYYNNGRVGIGRMSFESYFDTKLWVHGSWLQVTDTTGHDAGIVVNNLSKTGYGFARSLHQVYSGVFGDPYTEFRIRDNDDIKTVISWSLGIDHADENKLKITNQSNCTTGASPTYGENIMSIATNGDVGIGTSDPLAKLEVADGDIYISDINRGIIMKSPDGNCWRGTIDNSGNLVFSNIDCPGETQNPIDISDARTDNAVSIYPNPAGNNVTIALLNDHYKNSRAFIYTIDGKIVKKDQLDTDYMILDVDNLRSGTYVIRVVDGRGKELGSETMVKK